MPYDVCRNFITKALALVIVIAAVVKAATEKEKENFPEFAKILDRYDYNWETHKVKTDDGWHLTLFRIKPSL